jgi:hypothetical protein
MAKLVARVTLPWRRRRLYRRLLRYVPQRGMYATSNGLPIDPRD